MKRLLLILVIFLAYDCCWARKLEHGDHFRLDGKRANSFLVHKRSKCSWLEYLIEMTEECCNEGCDAEEVNEYGGFSNPEQTRKDYLRMCC